MKKLHTLIILFLLSFFAVGCSSEQQVLWNLSSEKGEEIKIIVRQEYGLFYKTLTVHIDGDEVIKGTSGKDKKTEYSAEYKGKSVKAFMICDSKTNDEIVELTVDGKLVGEFTFPKKDL